MELTTAEMFSGIGGLRFGLERSEWKTVWANDWEYAGCVWDGEKKKWKGSRNQSGSIYTKHWNDNTYIDADIRTIDHNTIPNHTLLTAGFPCQSFSLAGKREGFRDIRGTLFFEVIRIAKAKKPTLLLLENVKGLLSNNGGQTFGTLLEELGGIGYWCEWQVLNSKYFGVPQNRERVFIVGHSRERSTQQIFPIRTTGEVPSKETKNESESGEASTLEATYGKTKNLSNMVAYHQNKSGNVALHEEAQALRSGASHSYQGIIESALIQSRGLETRKDGLSHCVKGGSGGTSKNHIQIFDGHHKQFTKKMGTLTGRENRQGTNWLVANCLDQDGYLRTGARPRDENGKPQLLPIGYRRIRRLTPIECERLQGFPDGWTEGVSDTQRYKLLGNAVTVNVAEFLGRRIAECLS